MATERQIASNLANSARSSGPKSELGKSRSSLNSTRHGLASESSGVEGVLSPEFAERRAKWAAEHELAKDSGEWALDRAVAASFQIERCERAIEDLVAITREHARLVWDQDKAIEAAIIAARLAKNPVLASRQLEATFAGVILLIEAWLGLAAALRVGVDWSESEASRALDMLGVAPDLRNGFTLITPPEGVDPVAHHVGVALDEVDRLEKLRDEALIPLDALERSQAMSGDVTLLSKPAKLLLRYERDAWRRYREAMTEITKAQDPSSAEVAPRPTSSPVKAESPPKIERAEVTPSPSFEAEPEATPAALPASPSLGESGQVEAPQSPPAPVTERTQIQFPPRDQDLSWTWR